MFTFMLEYVRVVRTPDVVPLSEVPLFIFPVIESLIYGQAGRKDPLPTPRTVLVRVSSAHANRVAFFIESIKSGKSPLF